MDIIKILQREIHDWKVKWGELKEQNVSLQGFKKWLWKNLQTMWIGNRSAKS